LEKKKKRKTKKEGEVKAQQSLQNKSWIQGLAPVSFLKHPQGHVDGPQLRDSRRRAEVRPFFLLPPRAEIGNRSQHPFSLSADATSRLHEAPTSRLELARNMQQNCLAALIILYTK
jgi:hypothetical protein